MSSDTKTISQLPVANPLTGDELIPVVQNGITKRATIDQIQTETLGGQQFITVDSEPGLPQSRQLAAIGGLQFTDNGPLSTFELSTIGFLNSLSALGTSGITVNSSGTAIARTLTQPVAGISISNPDGVAGNPTFSLTNDLAALEGLSSTGFAVRTAADTWAQRSIVQPSAGISISNQDGVAGNPTLALTNDLAALEGLSSTGFAVRTGTDTWAQRSIAGTANEVAVTNGNGVSGNPTISLPSALTFTGKTVTGGTFSGGTFAPTTFTVLDTAFTIQDNVDPTKQVKFEASGVTAGTTRTYTLPDQSDTIVVLGLAQTLANKTLTSPTIAAIANLTTNGYVKTSGGVGTLSVQTTPIPATDGGTGAVTLTAHGVLLGEGTSPIVATAAMTDGQLLVGQTGADPLPKTITGGVTITAAGAATVITNANLTGPVTSVGNATSVANNAITNAMLAQMPANTILGNNTGGTANAIDLTPAQVSAMLASPQVAVQTSGSGTYTTPTGAKYLLIELVGGGGGGGGSGTGGGTGGSGTASTVSTLSGGGGTGGANLGGTSSGGVSSGGDVNLQGGAGQGADALINTYGGNGGVSFFGGSAPGGAPGIGGTAGVTNTGSGGGGGGTGGIVAATGSGGGGGGYCRKLQTSPAATYAYTVGAGGAGGTAGTSGTAGGAGATGLIIITAYFQ